MGFFCGHPHKFSPVLVIFPRSLEKHECATRRPFSASCLAPRALAHGPNTVTEASHSAPHRGGVEGPLFHELVESAVLCRRPSHVLQSGVQRGASQLEGVVQHSFHVACVDLLLHGGVGWWWLHGRSRRGWWRTVPVFFKPNFPLFFLIQFLL